MRSVTLVVLLLIVSAGCLSGVPETESERTVNADPSAESKSPSSTESGTETTTSRTSASTAETLIEGPRVTVTDVVDGDTVTVAYPNGTRETVRLLGVDTPEVHVPNDPAKFEGVPETEAGARCLDRAGENASTYAKERLTNESVTLVFDERSDRRGYYGRLLAYVRVGGESFNGALIQEGRARVYPSTFTERERYERTEAAARDARRGLWSCVDAAGGTATTDTATPPVRADGGGPLAVAEIRADAAGNDHENRNDEYVVFRNVGEARLDLSGWTVADEADHTYGFPDGTTIAPGEELTLRTGPGRDTDSTLHWGADTAVWNNDGDVIVVRDESDSPVLRRAY